MIRLAQRFVALMLVLSITAATQAAICPMKLQKQDAVPCSAPRMPNMQNDHRTAKHECCPSRHSHPVVQRQCPPAQLSACNSKMTCCSVDPQPARSPEDGNIVQPDLAAVIL